MARKKKLTQAELAAQAQSMEDAEVQRAFEQGITTLRDLISPSSIEINSNYFRLGTKYGRTMYVYGYPRTLYTGWLSPLINIDEVLDISMYIYPVDTAIVMKNNFEQSFNPLGMMIEKTKIKPFINPLLRKTGKKILLNSLRNGFPIIQKLIEI